MASGAKGGSATRSPIDDRFSITLGDCTFVGKDLSRPECVVAERDGTLWISDNRGGVTRRDPESIQTRIGQIPGTPNGIALEKSGALLVAEIDRGILYRLYRDGQHETILDNFQGRPLGAVNFVHVDAHGIIWITVSTRTAPRSEAIIRPIPDGYILRLEGGRTQLVAEGLCFPNEIRFDAAYRYAYVAESARGRIARLPLLDDGRLGAAEPFGPDPLFEGAIVDGIAFDALGGLWVTEVTRNGLFRLSPDGRCRCLIEDAAGHKLDFPASICFGGPDLRTAYLGSIRARQLVSFRSPVAGAPLAHWC